MGTLIALDRRTARSPVRVIVREDVLDELRVELLVSVDERQNFAAFVVQVARRIQEEIAGGRASYAGLLADRIERAALAEQLRAKGAQTECPDVKAEPGCGKAA
jgi:hypothetical protein